MGYISLGGRELRDRSEIPRKREAARTLITVSFGSIEVLASSYLSGRGGVGGAIGAGEMMVDVFPFVRSQTIAVRLRKLKAFDEPRRLSFLVSRWKRNFLSLYMRVCVCVWRRSDSRLKETVVGRSSFSRTVA